MQVKIMYDVRCLMYNLKDYVRIKFTISFANSLFNDNEGSV